MPTLMQMGSVVLDTLVVYLFIILVLSLIGHRQTSHLTPVELAVLMAIGSAVETSMIGGDVSLLAGLTSAGTLLVSNRVLSILTDRWVPLQQIVVGRPVILVYNGQVLTEQLRRSGLTREDVLEGIRERGYDNLDDVRMALLEIGGDISVIPRDKKGHREES